MICPRRRVAERPFRITDKHRASPDRRIVAIGADALPSRAVVQFNEHLVIERALPGLWRERFVDASLPGMSVEIGRATSELKSLMRISYAVFCLKKKISKNSLPT